jgi:hypothetical protein
MWPVAAGQQSKWCRRGSAGHADHRRMVNIPESFCGYNSPLQEKLINTVARFPIFPGQQQALSVS